MSSGYDSPGELAAELAEYAAQSGNDSPGRLAEELAEHEENASAQEEEPHWFQPGPPGPQPSQTRIDNALQLYENIRQHEMGLITWLDTQAQTSLWDHLSQQNPGRVRERTEADTVQMIENTGQRFHSQLEYINRDNRQVENINAGTTVVPAQLFTGPELANKENIPPEGVQRRSINFL